MDAALIAVQATLAVLLAGYLVVEGGVIGAGMRAWPARTTASTTARTTAAAPAHPGTGIGVGFLLSEAWTVAVIGLLAGAFTAYEAGLLVGAYPFAAAYLVAWLVRDGALWFGPRRASARWARTWSRLLAASSAVMASASGALLGAAVAVAPAGHHVEAGAAIASPLVWLGAITAPVLMRLLGSADASRTRTAATIAAAGFAVALVAVGSPVLTGLASDPATLAVIAAAGLPVLVPVIAVQFAWWLRSRSPSPFFTWPSPAAAAPVPAAAPAA
ncbi:cytochrome d ubiquinol oxidase subunit II [Agromyces sp. LHK192]|uniref:cytochrome d ubiquinol oxidase subunit II n=1 Tax=Agromyces sp. LHK192 TaxID=2498704 RepID=UPI000FDAEC4F|nr:cytochrome d ubiquinol oxidase subunit II [Agromyces sp. LHK192]